MAADEEKGPAVGKDIAPKQSAQSLIEGPPGPDIEEIRTDAEEKAIQVSDSSQENPEDSRKTLLEKIQNLLDTFDIIDERRKESLGGRRSSVTPETVEIEVPEGSPGAKEKSPQEGTADTF